MILSAFWPRLPLEIFLLWPFLKEQDNILLKYPEQDFPYNSWSVYHQRQEAGNFLMSTSVNTKVEMIWLQLATFHP